MLIRDQIYNTTDRAFRIVEEQKAYVEKVLGLSRASVEEVKAQVFEQTKRWENEVVHLIGERVLKKLREVRQSIDPMFSQAVHASEVTRDRLGLHDNETVNNYIGQIEKMKAALAKEAERLEAYANEKVSVKRAVAKKKSRKKAVKKVLKKTEAKTRVAKSKSKVSNKKKAVVKKASSRSRVNKKATAKKKVSRKKS